MAKGLIWGLMHLCHLLFQNQFIQNYKYVNLLKEKDQNSIFVLKIIIVDWEQLDRFLPLII